jgi:hypothetical protein
VIVIKTEISNKPCHWDFDWLTISLDCIILPVTWFIRYLYFYYYHCVYTSTGGLLVLIVSSSQWHGLLDISCFYYYQCVYTSTGGLLVLIVSSSHWHGLLDISVVITITVSIHLLVDYYSREASDTGEFTWRFLSRDFRRKYWRDGCQRTDSGICYLPAYSIIN